MGGVSRSFRRISDRSGDTAKIGEIRYFERDPGSNWIACDGRALAATAENKVLFAPDSGSLSTSGLGTVGSDSPPNIRGAVLGDRVLIPFRNGTVHVSPNRGVSWGATLSLGSGNSFTDSVAFGDKFVVSVNNTLRVSSDGGSNWATLLGPTVGGRVLQPYRMKVVGGALYAISANGREIFRTTDLSTWTLIDLAASGMDFGNEQGVADFDYDPVNNEWVVMTFASGNRQGFYRSSDLVTFSRIGSAVLDGYFNYLTFTGGKWVASSESGAKMAVRAPGGVFIVKSEIYPRFPPVWTGADFVLGGQSSGLVSSYDLESFVTRPAIPGFTNYSAIYFAYQFADGDLLAVQTSSQNIQRFASSRAVRAPTPPPIRPNAVRGKPYLRVR